MFGVTKTIFEWLTTLLKGKILWTVYMIKTLVYKILMLWIHFNYIYIYIIFNKILREHEFGGKQLKTDGRTLGEKREGRNASYSPSPTHPILSFLKQEKTTKWKPNALSKFSLKKKIK